MYIFYSSFFAIILLLSFDSFILPFLTPGLLIFFILLYLYIFPSKLLSFLYIFLLLLTLFYFLRILYTFLFRFVYFPINLSFLFLVILSALPLLVILFLLLKSVAFLAFRSWQQSLRIICLFRHLTVRGEYLISSTFSFLLYTHSLTSSNQVS